MQSGTRPIQLLREGDKVLLRFADEEATCPVRLVWARPISARGREVGFLDEKKNEVATVESLDQLDAESRRVAEEELALRYLVPRITRVLRTRANFGVRYWHVVTDRGERRFTLKNASKNATWVGPDHLVLRDTLGCRYEIPALSALDLKSRREVEKVI